MKLYAIYFPNGKRYVGVTEGSLAERRRGGYSGMLVGRALKAHGGDMRLLLEGPREMVLRLEECFIRLWGTRHPNGYNLAAGGCHTLMDEDMRAKTSERLTNQWGDEEWASGARAAMRRAWTPERRAKQAETARRQHQDKPEMTAGLDKYNEGRTRGR